jgi:hypothetical protein
MKHKKVLLGVAAVATLALVATGVVYDDKLPWSNSGKTEGESQEVTEDGGTHSFPNGIVITVPKGAVKKNTTLTVGGTSQQSNKDAGPLQGMRAGGILFDVSLSRDGKSDIQPLKPLEITIPLSGSLLPQGADPSRALLYTATSKGFLLLPSKVEGENVLKGLLLQLSPKYVTYVSDEELLDAFFPEKVESDRGKCAQEITVAGQKYRIGDKSRGWSLKDDSPIFACLSMEDGSVRIGVANRIEYMLSVAATSNVRLAISRGNATEEANKMFASLIPNQKRRGFLGNGGELVGLIAVDKLPGTIDLQADPGTFLSESVVRVVTLAIGVLSGKGNLDENLKIFKELMDNVALVSCLEDAMAPLLGKEVNLGSAVNTVTSCLGTLIEAMTKFVDVGALLGRALLVVDAIKGIFDTGVSAWNGIKLSVTNTLRVQVVKVPPPPPPFSFVGKWERYRALMEIRADGTGEWRWGGSAWESQLLTFRYVPRGANELQATITGNWNLNTDTGEKTPTVADKGHRVGDTFQFINIGGSRIQFTGFPYDYWCRPGFKPADDPNCEQ